MNQPATRRDELLGPPPRCSPERGLRATTVRDIADAAESSPAASITTFPPRRRWWTRCCGFPDWLFDRYQEIIDTEPNPDGTA